MADRDARPLYSPMPEHLATIYDRLGRATAEMVLKVLDEAMLGGAATPPAERENDAFSLASQVISLGLFGLAAQMADMKRVTVAAAAEILLIDVGNRVRSNLCLLQAAREAQGATRQ